MRPVVALTFALLSFELQAEEQRVDFVREVQPVFRRHCYRCHGATRARARLRLTSLKALKSRRKKAEPLYLAGHPEKSLLIQRLTDPSAGDVMPLDSNPLSAKELSILRRWIKEGAPWPEDASDDRHWAYLKPTRPAIPNVPNSQLVNNPIDRFIQSQLSQVGLTPAAEVDRARLLRRASLALTGLPPTPAEIDSFLKDQSPNAYEKVIDRLLGSKAYGEKWAQQWLDLARYADSNGFQADQLRDSWAYRDYVIRAMNSDMPFDRFTIEQLAGDLLPNPTRDQKIATGFHRTVTCNVEAGVHPESNRIDQVVDRVNTTGLVFLGTTLECCQCHDHKYDPFTQKEYYQLFAYFNNTPLEVASKGGVQFDFTGPRMDLPYSVRQRKQREFLTAALNKVKPLEQKVRREQLAGYPKWKSQARSAFQNNPAFWEVLPIAEFQSTGREEHEILKDHSVLLSGSLPGTAVYTLTFQGPLHDVIGLKIEALTHDSLPGKGPGRGDAERTNFILSELTVDVQRGDKVKRLSLHDPKASFSQRRWPIENAIDGNRKTGWAIAPKFHQSHWATFRLKNAIHLGENDRIVLKLDQNFGRGRTLGCVRVSALIGDPLTVDFPPELARILKKEKPTGKDEAQLRLHYMNANPELRKLQRERERLTRQLNLIKPPTTLVMVEMEKGRETHILNRGNYLDPGSKVAPSSPAILHRMDPSLPRNRLGFARWLTSKENPLLARVTVNRWWAAIFGRGIVTTPEDFGTQGESPSHPALLDWLATELMEKGWSMKHMHKLMVMSHAFRQTARITSTLLRRDPENRYLARGPRFRLSAETIRDNALSIAGLLSAKMYGKPIMPYQPSGIWKAVGRNQPRWVTSTTEDRFRRGLYVVWKRGAPYPSFVNFDAPDRASCTVQRARTNTPLQALTLLNDPAYAEMAVALAQRMMTESNDKSPESRVKLGFRLALARLPSKREILILARLFEVERNKLKSQPKLVEQRLANLLPSMRKPGVSQLDLAAWFAVANVLLNLDETVSQ